MSLSLSELRSRYWLKIGESSESTQSHSETTVETNYRLNDAYRYIQRVTGCTYKKPELVSLTAVTASTNYHDLSKLLSLTSGASVMSIHEVFWEGIPLYEWNKDRIDQMNKYDSVSAGEDPIAYAFFSEGAGNDRVNYISFFPYVASDNSTDCYISYFELLPDMSDDDYPRFDAQWHDLIADIAARDYQLDSGDAKLSPVKIAQVEDRLNSMKANYYRRLQIGEAVPAAIGAQNLHYGRFYGE